MVLGFCLITIIVSLMMFSAGSSEITGERLNVKPLGAFFVSPTAGDLFHKSLRQQSIRNGAAYFKILLGLFSSPQLTFEKIRGCLSCTRNSFSAVVAVAEDAGRRLSFRLSFVPKLGFIRGGRKGLPSYCCGGKPA